MDKYAAYTNLYELITHYDNNTNIHLNLQKLITLILQNAEHLHLSSGQIKLAFCFISKVKLVIHNVQESLKIIQSELLVDYSPIQLTKINTLLSHGNELHNSINPQPLPDILKSIENINCITTQDQYNHILSASCDYVESYHPIPNNPVIHKLVNYWFYLDEMYL
jgi:hypothetical protein